MSVQSKFKTSKEAKEANWFSRRHETSEEHQEAKIKRIKKKESKKK